MTETNLRCRTIRVTGLNHMCGGPYWLTCAERRYEMVSFITGCKAEVRYTNQRAARNY